MLADTSAHHNPGCLNGYLHLTNLYWGSLKYFLFRSSKNLSRNYAVSETSSASPLIFSQASESRQLWTRNPHQEPLSSCRNGCEASRPTKAKTLIKLEIKLLRKKEKETVVVKHSEFSHSFSNTQ
jgi:hypothetical protein